MIKTTTKWTLKSANEYLENMMTKAGLEHNCKIAAYPNRTKYYYYIVEKKTGYNIMSWSWDTLRQLMSAIEKDKTRFIEAMIARNESEEMTIA